MTSKCFTVAVVVAAFLACTTLAAFNDCGDQYNSINLAGSQNLIVWDTPGSTLTLTCVELSTTGPANVVLSVSCSDQIAFNASSQYLNLGAVGSNCLWNPMNFSCPINGYFYLQSSTVGTAVAKYGAYGTVDSSVSSHRGNPLI